MPESDDLYICWTTVSDQEEAELLADQIIQSKLAACVQIDSPIISVYRWQGKIEKDPEVRICINALESSIGRLESFVHEHHPYDTPKWVCAKAEKVSEKYLKWANEVCNLRGFI
ncbi:divalent cation tolerance protein, CutA1 family [Verrucomicrobiia bacterium DG1235]|nr:divalent cation tolerance protein, CutA1 family [Verrucomicrobiae bacterium DG1235]